jgi:hypothetical protein
MICFCGEKMHGIIKYTKAVSKTTETALFIKLF